jgi:hypothetical protein
VLELGDPVEIAGVQEIEELAAERRRILAGSVHGWRLLRGHSLVLEPRALYAWSTMSEPSRRFGPTAPEARAKTLSRDPSAAWRVELATWGDDDWFAWTERVAIMVVQGGLEPEQAEHAAFLDVSRHRIR